MNLLSVVILVVAIVVGLTVAIIAAAPYIAIGVVIAGAVYLALGWDGRDDEGPPGPPTVR
jgi:hypothetical protein